MSTEQFPHRIVILPARRCRRSRKIMQYLDERGIPYTRIPLETDEGVAIAQRYNMRASPGILVDGVSHNPFEILDPDRCRVDEEKARALFGPHRGQ
ncbi:MAG TPA: hypothetical protein ENJ54_10920 [Chloroflexi bacterium]|nr:hypothetical protein [Chloroflexota bacterium]